MSHPSYRYMMKKETSLCGDKDDKCIISKLNIIYHAEHQKRESQKYWPGHGTEGWQSRVSGAPLTLHRAAHASRLNFLLLKPFISAWYLAGAISQSNSTKDGDYFVLESEGHMWLGCIFHQRGGRFQSHPVCGHSAAKPCAVQELRPEHPWGSSRLTAYECSGTIW